MPDILCFGDSNTYGSAPLAELGVVRRYKRARRWPWVMARALGAGWHVIEEGHPGRTTVRDDPLVGEHRNGARVLPSMLESHKPDLLVVMLGTNDLKAQFAMTAQDVALGAGRLVDMAQGSGFVGQILLIAPVLVEERGCLAEMFTSAAAKSCAMGAHFAQVAQMRGVAFLDAAEHVAPDPLDGVHLSAASHEVLGLAVAAKLQEIVA